MHNLSSFQKKSPSAKVSLTGFTLIELIIVIFIIALLTTLVTINFAQLRISQEIRASAQDTISKIREVQNFVLTGQTQGGVAPQAYEIALSSGSSSYTVKYDIDGTLTTLETVNLTKNTKVNKLTVGGVVKSQTTIRITSPFGQILVDGVANQTVQIEVSHTTATNRLRTVVIDGISGRISAQ